MTANVFIGIRGTVFCLERDTGATLWATHLKGSEFVNLMVDGGRVLATSRGEAFCLDAQTGTILWHNELPGQGWGVAAIATASGASSPSPEADRLARESSGLGNVQS
jgi:outer membrane protein assembly factor BamB